MKMFRVSILPGLVAAAAALFCAQAAYALLSLDLHYKQVQRQVQQWCEKAPGCAGARLTGDLSEPEITIDLRGKTRSRAGVAERIRSELNTNGVLVVAGESDNAARPVAIRIN